MREVAPGDFRWRAMASPVQFMAPQIQGKTGLETAVAVAKDLIATEGALSRFWESSELTTLNRNLLEWRPVSWRLYKALAAAGRAHAITQGRFDPSVLTVLERLGYPGVPVPLPSETHREGPFLERRPRTREVRVLTPLDLGGIGKGLGVRWASRVALRATRNFLLNAGGDIFIDGSGADGQGWTVGVEDPRAPEKLMVALRLKGPTACCTSSVARKKWMVEGRPVHHLIDPARGEPGGEGLLSVTVLHPDPAWAEVFSKTLFLAGRHGITEAAKGRSVLWVEEDGALAMTPGMEEKVFWRAE